MPVSIQANLPVAGVSVSGSAKRLVGGPWQRIKRLFRGSKPPPGPQVTKSGDQWVIHRPERSTATVLQSLVRTDELRRQPPPPQDPSPAAHGAASPSSHAGSHHAAALAGSPGEQLDQIGAETGAIEDALAARDDALEPDSLTLDDRFKRAATGARLDAALKSIDALHAAAGLDRQQQTRLAELEDRLYRSLISLQMPKLGAVIDDLRSGEVQNYLDHAVDAARLMNSFDPTGSGVSLLATPEQFVDGMMNSMRTLHRAGALDSDLMGRLARFGRTREWSQSDFQDDNWKAADSLETQLRLLATGNEGAIDWLLGAERSQDDRGLAMKLQLREVRAEQAKRTGGTEREREVQPETLIRARHELQRANRDLGRLLTGEEGTRNNRIFGRGSHIRIDKNVIDAMRRQFGKEVGRDVNLLLANVMLLQRKVDQLERQPTIDDVQAKLATAKEDLDQQKDAGLAQCFDPDDEQQLEAARLVDEALTLGDRLVELGTFVNIDAAQLDSMDDRQLQELDWKHSAHDRVRERLDTVNRQLRDLRSRGVVDKDAGAILDRRPSAGVEALRASAAATLAVDQASTDLAAATADLKLGLDDRELEAIGLGTSEIRDLHTTIGRLAGQGLRSSGDVEQVTRSIEKGLKLLQSRISQSSVGQLSRGFAESQANLLMDLVFQDVTGDHHNLDLGAGSDQVRAGFHEALDVFLTDPQSGDESVAAMQLGIHTESHARLQQDMAALSRQLLEADDRHDQALKLLAQAERGGRTIHPQHERCYAAATEILAALHADAKASDASLKGMDRLLWAAERDRLLSRLKGFDPQRMRVTSHGLKTRPAPPSIDQLRHELAPLEPLAVAITRAHDFARTTRILSGQIEAKAKELDDLRDLRRAAMHGDTTDPSHDRATDVFRLVQNGVRAAALHVRQQENVPLDQFNPNEHRDAIESVLEGFGIDPELFAPEIDETLHGAFGPQALSGWVEDAKKTSAAEDAAVHPKAQGFAGRLKTWLQSFRRAFGWVSDRAPVDQSTRTTVVSMIKSLRAGDAIELGRDKTLNLSSGRIPVVPLGAAKLNLRASLAVARKNQLEIECDEHEIEVFLKAGTGGEGSLEAAVDATVAEAALSGSLGGHRLEGIALRFPNTERGRQDLAAMMDDLMSEQPKVDATMFAKAEQVLMVTDRMVKAEAEAEALSTTAMLNEKFGGVFSKTTAANDNGYPMDVEIGAKAQFGAGVEARVIRSSNANNAVYEKEVEKDVVMHLRLGVFSEMASGYDTALNQVPGLADPVSRVLSHGARKEEEDAGDDSEPAPYANQAFGGIPRTLAGIGYDTVLLKTTKVTRVNQDSDGLYQSHGNELIRRRGVGRILKQNGRVDSDRMLKSLALDIKDDPRERGLETDPLSKALADDPEFRAAVDALMQQVRKGDRLSVTYTLDPAVRRTANELREEAAGLRRQRAGDEDALKRANELDRQAKKLIDAESSYLPLNVQIVKSGATKVEVDLLNIKLLKLERTGYGGLRRAAITATNPANPEAQAHHAHDHGHAGPTVPLAPEIYFGSSFARTPAPRPNGDRVQGQPQSAPSQTTAPDPTGTGTQPPSAAEILKPALDGFRLLKNESSLILASPYRPLDGQLNHMREGLATLRATINSLDPDAKLDLAEDLRSRLKNLAGAVDVAATLPRAPEPGKLEQDYSAVKSRQSEPLVQTIHRARDHETLKTPGPVGSGQKFYAEDQQFAACAIHALNAFIGGPVVSPEALSEFNVIHAHGDQVAPHLDVPNIDARFGNEADVPYKLLRYMNDHKALPHAVAFHLIDRVGNDLSAQRNIPPIPGDRCIVNTQNPAHFVAFRKDEAGNWWKIDSVPRKNQTRMTPEAYLRERMRQPDNGFIGVTTLAG